MVKMHVPVLTVLEQAAQDGLRVGMRHILKRARELSPTDTGDSDKSGFTRIDDLTGQVGFTSLVSRLQHEDLDATHSNGEQAKFLETAATEVDVAGIIAAKTRDALSG